MWNLSKTILPIVACASLMVSGAAQSHPYHRSPWHGEIRHFHGHDFDLWRGGHWHHGRHGGRPGWWWVAGGIWYFYPVPVYPYPDPYYPPTVEVPSVPVAPPAPAAPVAPVSPQPAASQYWYYCSNPAGYYPYVPACKVPWQKVPAVPE